MKIISDFDFKLILVTLQKGGLVIMPTETLYGAFVDATNVKAVTKLNNYKQRPMGKPYSVAVSDQIMAEKYVQLNKTALNLYTNFLPGPLTVISKGKGRVAQGVESETGTLGVRFPDHKPLLDIIKEFGKPLTATSANASYKKRPYKILDILDNLSEKQKNLIDLIVDVGELPRNEPSTVIDTTLDDTTILRQGDISFGNNLQITSNSEEDTKNIAKNFLQKYEGHIGTRSIIFALEGEMGTGKTVFTKGLAKYLRIKETITSPTYDLENEYQGSMGPLLHLDVWRMGHDETKDTSLIKAIITKKYIIAVEWAEKIKEEILSHDDEAIIVWVKIEYGKNKNQRLISWSSI